MSGPTHLSFLTTEDPRPGNLVQQALLTQGPAKVLICSLPSRQPEAWSVPEHLPPHSLAQGILQGPCFLAVGTAVTRHSGPTGTDAHRLHAASRDPSGRGGTRRVPHPLQASSFLWVCSLINRAPSSWGCTDLCSHTRAVGRSSQGGHSHRRPCPAWWFGDCSCPCPLQRNLLWPRTLAQAGGTPPLRPP